MYLKGINNANIRPAYRPKQDLSLIPRNHQVEAALSSAVDEADLGPFERLLAVLGRPYETVESARPFTLPASPEVAAAHRTFCGT